MAGLLKYNLLAATFLLTGIIAAHGQTQTECLSNEAARALVSQGDILSASQVRDIVVERTGGEVVRVDLCDDGRLVYRVVVLSSSGRASNIFLDARQGD